MRTAKVLETQYLRGRASEWRFKQLQLFRDRPPRVLGALGASTWSTWSAICSRVPRVASKQDTTNSETHNLFAVGIPSLA